MPRKALDFQSFSLNKPSFGNLRPYLGTFYLVLEQLALPIGHNRANFFLGASCQSPRLLIDTSARVRIPWPHWSGDPPRDSSAPEGYLPRSNVAELSAHETLVSTNAARMGIPENS